MIHILSYDKYAIYSIFIINYKLYGNSQEVFTSTIVCNVNLQISKNCRYVITYSGQIVKVNSHNYLCDIIYDYMLSLLSFLLSFVYIRMFN